MGEIINNKDFVIEDGVLVEYRGEGADVVIPEGVTCIRYSIFSKCENIRSLVIPNGITEIGSWTFFGCVNLESVTLPNTVTTIGEHAFAYCKKLKNITVPDSVEVIENCAFASCESLTSITVPGNVKSVGDEAFSHCASLKTVTICDGVESLGYEVFHFCDQLSYINIPKSLVKIGYNIFWGNYSIEKIEVSEDNPVFSSIDGNMYSKDKKTLIYYATGKKQSSFTLPFGVTHIRRFAFSFSNTLENIVFSDSVTKIEENAIYFCNGLKGITIGKGLTDIDQCFMNLTKGVESIAVDEENLQYASEDGNMYSKDKKTLVRYAVGKKDKSFTIPETVEKINGYAFYDSNDLETVMIPEGVVSIGERAFARSKIKSITIPERLTFIGPYAFLGCESLKKVMFKIPDGWETSRVNYNGERINEGVSSKTISQSKLVIPLLINHSMASLDGPDEIDGYSDYTWKRN